MKIQNFFILFIICFLNFYTCNSFSNIISNSTIISIEKNSFEANCICIKEYIINIGTTSLKWFYIFILFFSVFQFKKWRTFFTDEQLPFVALFLMFIGIYFYNGLLLYLWTFYQSLLIIKYLHL